MKGRIFLSNEAHSLEKVVMCFPKKEYFLVNDRKIHNITKLANRKKAILQYSILIETIRRFGTNILFLDELAGHPNSVFTQDTAIVTPHGFIKVSMGMQSRKNEAIWMANFLERSGIPCVGSIESPGTVEGGDVLIGGDVAFVGISSRTNREGANQVKALLGHQGLAVRIAEVPHPFLHLGGAMSVIAMNTILSVEGVFPPHFFQGFTVIYVPHNGFITGNVITLGNREVIVTKENSVAVQKLKRLKFIVHEVNLSEFTKGTGGPSCLIMPLERKSSRP